MNLLVLLVCVLLSLHLSCGPLMAETFSYTPLPTESIGSFKGQAPINKIGGVFGSDLSVFLDGPVMDVQQGSGTEGKTIASGVVFKTRVEKTGKGGKLTGFWYCRSGDRRADVLGKDADQQDVIETSDGRRLAGTITAIDREQVTMIDAEGTEHRLSTRQTEVHSPKVYEFSCILKSIDSVDLKKPFQAEIERMSFDTTFDRSLARQVEKQQAPKVVSKVGWSLKKKIIVFAVVGLVIATAIAVPIGIAVPVANHQRQVRNERNVLRFASLFNPNNQQQNQNQNHN